MICLLLSGYLGFRDLAKDPVTHKAEYYAKPLMEIAGALVVHAG